MINWEHSRFSDDEIYLNENRYNKPKETHQKILSLIKKESKNNSNLTVLDCGCATGELTYFLSRNLQNSNFTGFDISSKMISRAKERMPEIDFFVQDLLVNYIDWNIKPKNDFVLLSGVISAFDDFTYIINNLISCSNKNGKIIITVLFNKDPIDVIMRYKRSNSEEWECGWNTTSKESYEKYLNNNKLVKSFYWEDVSPPQNVPKRENDPMRKWTSNFDGANTLVVGSGQIINVTILVIKLN